MAARRSWRISRGVDMFSGESPVGSRKRVPRSSKDAAFLFMALVSWVVVSPTARPRAEIARLSDPSKAACSRSRLDRVMPSSRREGAPPRATSESIFFIVVNPSRSRLWSITTRVAANLEMEAIARGWSGLRAKISRPLSRSTTSAPSDSTLGRLPFTATTCFSKRAFFLANGFLPWVFFAGLILSLAFAVFLGAGLPLGLPFDLPGESLATVAWAAGAAAGANSGMQHAATSSRIFGAGGTDAAG